MEHEHPRSRYLAGFATTCHEPPWSVCSTVGARMIIAESSASDRVVLGARAGPMTLSSASSPRRAGRRDRARHRDSFCFERQRQARHFSPARSQPSPLWRGLASARISDILALRVATTAAHHRQEGTDPSDSTKNLGAITLLALFASALHLPQLMPQQILRASY
ncbi:hypothetical protein L1887_59221 [Cichorium endivia]|nr:hypothetical protein L1887_59221 [Cichorium endivia]